MSSLFWSGSGIKRKVFFFLFVYSWHMSGELRIAGVSVAAGILWHQGATPPFNQIVIADHAKSITGRTLPTPT